MCGGHREVEVEVEAERQSKCVRSVGVGRVMKCEKQKNSKKLMRINRKACKFVYMVIHGVHMVSHMHISCHLLLPCTFYICMYICMYVGHEREQ